MGPPNPYAAPRAAPPSRRWLIWLALAAVVTVVAGLGLRAAVRRLAPGPVCQSGDVTTSEAACDDGSAFCCSVAGLDYMEGKGVRADNVKAHLLLARACSGHDAAGCFNLGLLNQREKDWKSAVERYDLACQLQMAPGCSMLGWFYEVGQGVEKDARQARRMYQRACELAKPLGCVRAGQLSESDLDGDPQETETIGFYRAACDAKDAQGCEEEARWSLDRTRSEADVRKVAERLQERCSSQVMRACSLLAKLGDERPSLALDVDAVARTACAGKEWDACTRLAVRAIEHRSVRRPPREPRQMLEEACENKNETACARLGDLLFQEPLTATPSSGALRDAWLRAARAGASDAARSSAIAERFVDDPAAKYRAQLLLAAADIDAGRWESAGQHLNASGDDPFAKVLRALLVRRRTHVTEDWAHAGLNAWVEAGRPDLRESAVFRDDWGVHVTGMPLGTLSGWESRVTDPLQRLIVRAWLWQLHASEVLRGWPEPPTAAMVAEALLVADDPRPWARRLALHVLRNVAMPDPAARARAVKLARELADAEPDNAFAQLQPVTLTASEGPFSEAELKELDRISALPHYDSRWADSYALHESALIAAGCPSPTNEAFGAATNLMETADFFRLSRRLRVTARDNPTTTEVVARVSVRLAHLLDSDGSELETAVAAMLVRQVGRALNDANLGREADELYASFQAMRHGVLAESPIQLFHWPLPHLWSESLPSILRGERAYFSRLVEELRDQ